MLEPLTKKVELLRALERTKAQFDDRIDTGANEGFSEEDKDLIESFKKIFHVGLDQLEKFINDLEEKGEKVDPYTILYYTKQLRSSPFYRYLAELIIDKKYWIPSPNTMGVCGNTGRANSSTPVIQGKQLGANVDIFYKAPVDVILKVHNSLVSSTTNVFNSNFQSSVVMDNTKPYINKNGRDRVKAESENGLNTTAHGNYMVKDVEFQKIVESVSADIFDKVKELLGEQDYRLFVFKKALNLFDKEENLARSYNASIKRKVDFMSQSFKEDGTEVISVTETDIDTDLQGNNFDGFKRREVELKIFGAKERKFKLYTVKGQLGSGDDVKEKPITE